MIQANELRFGIYILDAKNNDIVKVDFHTFNYIHNGRTEYNPIPLTEEILLECGLDTIDPILICNSDSDCVYLSDLPHVKYLHQLQNLYFALRGEELNVEL